jgi:hypothetical protein
MRMKGRYRDADSKENGGVIFIFSRDTEKNGRGKIEHDSRFLFSEECRPHISRIYLLHLLVSFLFPKWLWIMYSQVEILDVCGHEENIIGYNCVEKDLYWRTPRTMRIWPQRSFSWPQTSKISIWAPRWKEVSASICSLFFSFPPPIVHLSLIDELVQIKRIITSRTCPIPHSTSHIFALTDTLGDYPKW